MTTTPIQKPSPTNGKPGPSKGRHSLVHLLPSDGPINVAMLIYAVVLVTRGRPDVDFEFDNCYFLIAPEGLVTTESHEYKKLIAASGTLFESGQYDGNADETVELALTVEDAKIEMRITDFRELLVYESGYGASLKASCTVVFNDGTSQKVTIRLKPKGEMEEHFGEEDIDFSKPVIGSFIDAVKDPQ